MSIDVQIQAQSKIYQVIDKIELSLVQRLQNSGQNQNLNNISLNAQQLNLLKMLSEHQYQYKILKRLLICDFLINQLFDSDDKKEKVILNCYQNMTHLLQNFTLMSKVIQQRDKTLLLRAFTYSQEHLHSIVQQIHSFPVSLKNQQKKQIFVNRHFNILQQAKQERTEDRTQSEGQYLQNKLTQLQQQNDSLMEANQLLRENLSNFENKIIEQEMKIINLLKQNDQPADNQNELKQQIAFLRMEKDKMNQQFKYQINKYNQVFRNFQAEINQLKNYHNVDIVEELQTEIIRLREQIESDNIIIRELRERERQRSKKTQEQQHSLRYYSPRISNGSYSRYRIHN